MVLGICETGMAKLILILRISAILAEFFLKLPLRGYSFFCEIHIPSFRLIFMGWMLPALPGVLSAQVAQTPCS